MNALTTAREWRNYLIAANDNFTPAFRREMLTVQNYGGKK